MNAYFELSSNRRDIWYGSDMTGDGAVRSQWNASLLEDIIAPCYVALVVAAAVTLGPGPAYYSLWPDGAAAKEPWTLVHSRFYAALADKPVVHTAAGGGPRGKFVAPRDCVVAVQEDMGAWAHARRALLSRAVSCAACAADSAGFEGGAVLAHGRGLVV